METANTFTSLKPNTKDNYANKNNKFGKIKNLVIAKNEKCSCQKEKKCGCKKS